MATNLSDDISSAITGQTVNIVRAAAGLSKPVIAALMDLERELVDDLRLIAGKTNFTVERMNKLLAQARGTIAQAYGGIAVSNQQGMVKLAEVVARQTLGAVNEAIGVKLTSVDWTKEQLEAIANNTVVRGNFYEDWWKKQGADTRARFENEMRMGQLRGETVDQLAARVGGTRAMGYKDGVMAVSRAQAQALVRTSALGVSNAARMAAYAKNPDVIKGVQWVSTLDARTTPQCIALDGKRWNWPKGNGNADYADYIPVGHDKKFEVPPIHWNCRSTIIPITYSWKELAGEHGNSKAAAIADRVPRETRAAMDGQVARTTTFSAWLGKQTKEFQDEVLGVKRADLWRAGKLDLTGLTDQNNNPLTLDQLILKAPKLQPAGVPVMPAAPAPKLVPILKPPAPEVSDLWTFTHANVPAQPTDVMDRLQAAVKDAERKLDQAKAKIPPPAKPTEHHFGPPSEMLPRLNEVFAAINDKDLLLKEGGRLVIQAKNDTEVRAVRAAMNKRMDELNAAAPKLRSEAQDILNALSGRDEILNEAARLAVAATNEAERAAVRVALKKRLAEIEAESELDLKGAAGKRALEPVRDPRNLKIGAVLHWDDGSTAKVIAKEKDGIRIKWDDTMHGKEALHKYEDSSWAHFKTDPANMGVSTTDKGSLGTKAVKEYKRNHESGGIEESWVIKFTDGTKGIFKPITDWRNEVAASDIADMIGLSDLVPPTIERQLELPGARLGGATTMRRGSLQAFVERSKPAAKVGPQYGDPRAFDGPKDAARSAAWDYFIGNMDRHDYNWMIQDGKQIALIDHSRAINYDTYSFRSNLVRWAQGKSTRLGIQGPILQVPSEVAGWLAKWPEIEAYLHKRYGDMMPQRLIDGMHERLIELVKVGADPVKNTFAFLQERFRE